MKLLTDVSKITGKVFKSADEIDNRFTFVNQKRFLSLKASVTAPANVFGEVPKRRNFSVVRMCIVFADVAIVRQFPVPRISHERKTEHSVKLFASDFSNQVRGLEVIASTWWTELRNANSFEYEIRAFVPGWHSVATDRPLDAGAGCFKDVDKDKLSSCGDDHASRIIISQRSGQEKCFWEQGPQSRLSRFHQGFLLADP